jgi:hypothetical protein
MDSSDFEGWYNSFEHWADFRPQTDKSQRQRKSRKAQRIPQYR